MKLLKSHSEHSYRIGYDECYYQYIESRYISKKHIIRYVKFLFENRRTIRWLDIGCGLGYLVKEAIDEGIDAYGIEISEYALGRAVIKGRIIHGTITDIPFNNESFDVVSAIDVLEHVHPKDTLKALSEIHRVLKYGGFFIMITPNPCYFGNWNYDLTHINIRHPRYWKLTLESQGFKVKMPYIPSFLKYYVLTNYPTLRRFATIIPDRIAFRIEEPLRYIPGYIFSRKSRLYIFAIKVG